MTRDTLETILAEAPGAASPKPEKKGDKASKPPAGAADERTFAFDEEHRVSLYLSLGDSGTVVSEVVRLGLGTVLRVEQKDRTILFVEYAAVQALSVKPPRTVGESPRTGF